MRLLKFQADEARDVVDEMKVALIGHPHGIQEEKLLGYEGVDEMI